MKENNTSYILLIEFFTDDNNTLFVKYKTPLMEKESETVNWTEFIKNKKHQESIDKLFIVLINKHPIASERVYWNAQENMTQKKINKFIINFASTYFDKDDTIIGGWDVAFCTNGKIIVNFENVGCSHYCPHRKFQEQYWQEQELKNQSNFVSDFEMLSRIKELKKEKRKEIEKLL